MARAGRPGLRQIGDIQAEWAAANGDAGNETAGRGNYPMTVLVVDADFARAEPGIVRSILYAYRSSIEWVRTHPEEAGVLVEKHDLGLRAAVVRDAIPQSNYVFIPAAEARESLETLFRAFLEFAPPSIGGALPPDSFYLDP
jgi:NitT/TauT family transport system substrate-binding protein